MLVSADSVEFRGHAVLWVLRVLREEACVGKSRALLAAETRGTGGRSYSELVRAPRAAGSSGRPCHLHVGALCFGLSGWCACSSFSLLVRPLTKRPGWAPGTRKQSVTRCAFDVAPKTSWHFPVSLSGRARRFQKPDIVHSCVLQMCDMRHSSNQHRFAELRQRQSRLQGAHEPYHWSR